MEARCVYVLEINKLLARAAVIAFLLHFRMFILWRALILIMPRSTLRRLRSPRWPTVVHLMPCLNVVLRSGQCPLPFWTPPKYGPNTLSFCTSCRKMYMWKDRERTEQGRHSWKETTDYAPRSLPASFSVSYVLVEVKSRTHAMYENKQRT